MPNAAICSGGHVLRYEVDGVEPLVHHELGGDLGPDVRGGMERLVAGPAPRPLACLLAVGDGADELDDASDVARLASGAYGCSVDAVLRGGLGLEDGRRGAIQPSARRPRRLSIRGPEAPSQMPIRCAGAGPGAVTRSENSSRSLTPSTSPYHRYEM